MIFLSCFSTRLILLLLLLVFLLPISSAVAVINITQLTYGTDIRYSDPSWFPDGSKIIFTKEGIIHIMNADSSNITSTGQGGFNAKWSPDGSKIVFQQGDSIYIMNSNGSNQKLLIAPARSPSISPDGKYIAFHAGGVPGVPVTPEQGIGIFIMNIDGTDVKRLAYDYPHGNLVLPSWSPDGNKIVFTKGGIINIMDADGSNMTSTGQGGHHAKWSPDGKYIAFLSEQAGDMFIGMKLDHIYVMDIDDTNVTQLTFGDKRWDWTFDWSPDGTKIVLDSEVPPTAPKTIHNIYIMTLDFNVTSPTITPTATPTITQTPTFTPTAIATVTKTPKIAGFSFLVVSISLALLVLIKRIKR